jgi:predicted small lipoprotein YifL
MARFLTLTVLLVTMFVIAACGGGGPQGSERNAPAEPQQTQTVPAPAEDEVAKSTKETARRSEESPGLSVTTVGGEEVKLGAQGHVTALFFMAGW